MPIVIAILLGLSAALIVVYPLFVTDYAGATAAGPTVTLDASEREQSARQALRDLDFDYRLGNVEGSDYAELRETYERRALAALKARFERERVADALIDEQLARLRAQQAKKRETAGESAIGKRTNGSNRGSAPASPRPNGSRPTGRGPGARRKKGA